MPAGPGQQGLAAQLTDRGLQHLRLLAGEPHHEVRPVAHPGDVVHAAYGHVPLLEVRHERVERLPVGR